MKKVLLTLVVALSLWAEPAATMLPSTFALLENTQDRMGEKRYAEAAAKLEEAAKTLQKRPYDLAFVLHTRAYVALAVEEYAVAAGFFEQALALNALPENTQMGTLITLAQIALLQQSPDRAIALLKRWEKEAKNPAPQGFLLLASAYLEKSDYAAAYEPLKKAIALNSDAPSSWHRTLGGVCLELEKYTEAIGVYKGLAARSDATRADWMGLFYAYAVTAQESRALDALSAAFAAGVVQSEGDLIMLSRLQLNGGIPMRAVRLIGEALKSGRLEKKPETYELYAHALRLSREHDAVIGVLQEGSALAGGERLYEFLAHAAYEAGRYELAAQSAKKALDNRPKNPGSLWLLAGSAAYESGDLKAARAAFEKALAHEKSKTQAQRWLRHLEAL